LRAPSCASRGCALGSAARFTLDDIGDLSCLATATAGDGICTEARAFAAAQIGEIRAKIADLRAMERVLAEPVRQCDASEASRCPIIETLATG
jgi:MerR family mercuric resistance operon transcriptional regulator